MSESTHPLHPQFKFLAPGTPPRQPLAKINVCYYDFFYSSFHFFYSKCLMGLHFIYIRMHHNTCEYMQVFTSCVLLLLFLMIFLALLQQNPLSLWDK